MVSPLARARSFPSNGVGPSGTRCQYPVPRIAGAKSVPFTNIFLPRHLAHATKPTSAAPTLPIPFFCPNPVEWMALSNRNR